MDRMLRAVDQHTEILGDLTLHLSMGHREDSQEGADKSNLLTQSQFEEFIALETKEIIVHLNVCYLLEGKRHLLVVLSA
jgi:hypothetical protein